MAEPAAARRTLAAPAEVAGVGLFTGAASRLRILPAQSGGVRFRRVDFAGAAEIAACVANAFSPANLPGRNICLRANAKSDGVLTVEHVLSALAGLGISDALIELQGPEVPIGDGSALPFVQSIEAAGVYELPGERSPLQISETHTARANGAEIIAQPWDGAGCRYRYELDYGPGSPIPAQSAQFVLNPAGDFRSAYVREIAPARTFCLEAEARAMASAGLFKHVTPREMLVIGAEGPIDNTLRFADEPARHKLLDLIGDLALVGRPLQGEIIARRSGHALNREMAAALLEAFP